MDHDYAGPFMPLPPTYPFPHPFPTQLPLQVKGDDSVRETSHTLDPSMHTSYHTDSSWSQAPGSFDMDDSSAYRCMAPPPILLWVVSCSSPLALTLFFSSTRPNVGSKTGLASMESDRGSTIDTLSFLPEVSTYFIYYLRPRY